MNAEQFVGHLAELAGPIVTQGRLGEYNEFLQRSFPTWVTIRPRAPTKLAADPVLALCESYDMVGVAIANFKFAALSRDSDGLAYFGSASATNFWVREQSSEIYSMYYKADFPEPLGQSSASFLECLLLEVVFIASCTLRLAADHDALMGLYQEHAARLREHTNVDYWLDPVERAMARLTMLG
jgi:hypothetical protein